MGNLPARPIVAPYAMIAVCSHVLVALELKHPNFHKWAAFFKSLLGKFGLHGHIVRTVRANRNDPQWVMDDACVRNCLLGSITPNVQDLPMDGNQSACQL